MTHLTQLPKFERASKVAAQIGVTLEALYRASDAGQFARYYVFGSRKYYCIDEVAEAIKNQVPGDPARWRVAVLAADAAAPVQARRPRRARRDRLRGSSEATA